MTKERLLSHNQQVTGLHNTLEMIRKRIKDEGDKPYVTVARQLKLLMELSQFEFGRFLLQNRGINGYWTHYMLTYPWNGKKTGKGNRGESLTDLERFLLDNAPIILATQQRFTIFLQENQKAVKNNATLACIPCGMMGELLYLDFNNIDSIRLIGIDYDINTFKDAEILAEKQRLSQFIEFKERDAWQLNIDNKFDLISSNGLNIYESDDKKVNHLYAQFYKALKPGGKLVTSFLTYPPNIDDNSEWQMNKLNKEHLLLQRIIFSDIINAKWQCFRSTEKTKEQLMSVGYRDINILYDDAHMFPTVVSTK